MKVKICGLTTHTALNAAVEAGADMLGFVFAKSKREITPENAAALTKNMPVHIKKVGVFVSPTEEELQQIIGIAGLDMIQIHGELPLLSKVTTPVIRAVSVKNGQLPEKLAQETYDYLLLDAPPKEFVGGNGETFDWSELSLASLPDKPIIVAGGLTAENVAEARVYFNPYGVDVSSGVETNGQKDNQKIKNFIQAAKG